MKWTAGLAAILVAAAVAPGLTEEKVPGVGDKAPDFKLVGSDGKEYSLKQFEGKSAVVIAWYPKAATRG